MENKNTTVVSFIPAAQAILTAPDPEALVKAYDDWNAWLSITPVEQVLAQSGQLGALAELSLMDAVEQGMDQVSGPTLRACMTALHDWRCLSRPILPAPILSPTARKAVELAEDVRILEDYDTVRQDLWPLLEVLDEEEQDAVSGRISRVLAGLLIRRALPELVCLKRDPVLNRQYDLWSQLEECRRRGLAEPVPYFLRASGNCVRVQLPPATSFRGDAETCCSCARTLAVLYCQLPVSLREALFRALLEELEDAAADGVLNGECGNDEEAIRDLYLALRAVDLSGRRDYWNMVCYARHALREKEEN